MMPPGNVVIVRTDQVADLVATAEGAERVLDVHRVLGEVVREAVPVPGAGVALHPAVQAAYASAISSALNRPSFT